MRRQRGREREREKEREREREVTEKEKRLVISVVSPPSPFMVCRVSRVKENEKVVDVRATHVPNVFRTRWYEGTKEK